MVIRQPDVQRPEVGATQVQCPEVPGLVPALDILFSPCLFRTGSDTADCTMVGFGMPSGHA